MSINFFPLDGETNRAPRYKSTAFAEGFLADPQKGVGLSGATGTFSLWYEGQSVVTQRAMSAAADLGTGWVRCTISDTELAQRGIYQWEMVLKNANNTITLTDTGEFTI